MRPEKIIADAVTDIVAEHAPSLLADALSNAAAQTEDPLAEATLNIIASIARAEGPAAVNAASDAIVGLIDGNNPIAAFEFRDHPDELDALVNALQTAEAKQKAEAKKWARVAGATLKQFAGLVVAALAQKI